MLIFSPHPVNQSPVNEKMISSIIVLFSRKIQLWERSWPTVQFKFSTHTPAILYHPFLLQCKKQHQRLTLQYPNPINHNKQARMPVGSVFYTSEELKGGVYETSYWEQRQGGCKRGSALSWSNTDSRSAVWRQPSLSDLEVSSQCLLLQVGFPLFVF